MKHCWVAIYFSLKNNSKSQKYTRNYKTKNWRGLQTERRNALATN